MKYEATSQTRKMGILVLMIALLTLMYIFGASSYASDGTFGTLQAQGSNGAITGMTLSSDAPGTLTVSWETASPTPTDYRVDWAKSDEDYQSWKVDAGHKYPAPTATTVTIADLEHDTEYRVRMRARYYTGEHEDSPWGGPWVTSTITVAGAPAETPTPEPSPEPTPEPGTIDTIAATDDGAGQLVLTWGPPAAPNATPTDYQVSWAKTTQDYPADTAEAGNAHPTTTTLTLTGLEFDTDYNIRVRTRYSDGDHADSPWNGPWIETTAQVRQPLPAAPSFINTAVTQGQVLLAWSNPSDDSITGYQILRGPDAENMVVIEDNTGSTSTSYTDTAPPAGQTHTYGVKARNPAGLGPVGTATATVPEPEEEEPTIARHESTDGTLVSNLGQDNDGAETVAGPVGDSHYEQAIPFTTGTNASGYHLTGAQLYIEMSPTSTPQVSIRGDNGGLPGETVLSHLNTITTGEPPRLITFTATDDVTLHPNTEYWLHVAATEGIISIQQTESDDEDTESQAGWSIGGDTISREVAGNWTIGTAGTRLQMGILGHVGPSPSAETEEEITESVSEPADGDVTADTGTTGRLAPNGRVTGYHASHDVDWFKFKAEADTNYQFTANQGQRQAKLNVLRIFNDEGQEYRSSLITEKDGAYHAVDRLNSIAFRSEMSGIYYASIEDWNRSSSKVAYTLTMFDDDYSDDTDTTATVTVSESGRSFKDFHNYLMRTDANPESQTTDDVDWIRVALKRGVTYDIVYDVGCLHRGIIEGIYDPGIDMVFGPTEVQEIHASSGVTTNLCANLVTEFTPSLDGDHYIAVSAKAPTVVAACDPDCTATHRYPFQGVQGTLTINDLTAPPPPNNAATGDPLVRGERRVGSTLTGDTARITDANGLTNPMFEYQWQRMEDGTPADIPGEVSDTYILTDDDLGKRIQLQIRTTDDDGYGETRSGPATSIVTATNPRVLVSNLFRGLGHSAATDASSAFLTGLNPHGYVIDTVTMPHAHSLAGQPAEYRLYRSRLPTGQPVSASYPDLRTGGLLMSASPPERINGLNLTFGASSKVKLTPNTPYQNVLTSTGSNRVGCALSMEGVDSDSLTGFSIPQIARTYGRPTSVYSNACLFRISGFELTTSLFVKKVEITSTPNMEGMYATGEIIEVTATLRRATPFAEPSPALLLQIGENERQMEYVASSSTNTSWVFRYTVTADDRDDDGISFERNALRGYADADLSHRGMNSDPGHHVNAVPQLLSHRVSSKPVVPPWYTAGEKIQFSVEFSLPVTVVGDPQLEFNVTTPGPQNEFMSYESGSGTKVLIFSYTVGAGDDDPDGIWWNENSLRLDSDDSITATHNGLDADLDHTALNKLEKHRIDQNPRAISQEVTSDPAHGTDSDTYGAGDVITIEVVFNQLVTVAGAPRLRFSVTGPGHEYATYVSGSGTNTLVFSYTVLATEMDPDGIYLFAAPLDYPDAATDSIVGTSNSLAAVNAGIGKEGPLSGHKIDGTITN